MNEIGKMLGGWFGQLTKQNSPAKAGEKWNDLRVKKNRLLSFHLLSSWPLLLFNHDSEPFLLQLKSLRLPSRSRIVQESAYTTTLWILSRLYIIRHHNVLDSEPSNFIFEISAYTTLFQTLIWNILNIWILISVAENLSRLHIHLLSNIL
jgi:hypothetical protein